MKYPIVLFVFKRPEFLESQLSLIKEYDPPTLYVFADSPRNKVEKEATSLVRNIIESFKVANHNIEVHISYAQNNLGLKASFIQGLNKVFSQENAAIILEDDCLPDSSFFTFTSSMLSRYANNSQIMSVAGTAPGNYSKYSYDFSRYQLCWGWATWARAWHSYDPNVSLLGTKQFKEVIAKVTPHWYMRLYWRLMLKLVKSGWIDTWDYQWTYSLFVNNGLAIIPHSNLVQNVGFGATATNTKFSAQISNMKTTPLLSPYSHPPKIIDNLALSQAIENKFYNNIIAILGLLRQYSLWLWAKI